MLAAHRYIAGVAADLNLRTLCHDVAVLIEANHHQEGRRSDHNDLCVNSRYISRHHALFVKHRTATFLMDLNSTNGTYVNSQRVSNHVLLHKDVISIGNHGIKFHDPNARDSIKLDGSGFADTVVMKTLRDMRKLLARENTQSLPTPTEESLSARDPDQ